MLLHTYFISEFSNLNSTLGWKNFRLKMINKFILLLRNKKSHDLKNVYEKFLTWNVLFYILKFVPCYFLISNKMLSFTSLNLIRPILTALCYILYPREKIKIEFELQGNLYSEIRVNNITDNNNFKIRFF